MSSVESLTDLVRERGRLTVAAFMDLALYHPGLGYYARAVRRSGRAGDFVTSVDVGPLFGELLAVQFAEMIRLLLPSAISHPRRLDLVEVGAGDGRLSADALCALQRLDSASFDRVRLRLVEASAEARRAQTGTLGDVAGRLASSSADLPDSFEGVLFANELVDAMPVHQVVMRESGLREVFVVATRDGDGLRAVEDSVSTPALEEYLTALGIVLEPGWRAEINLRAIDWIREVARRLVRGFVVLIDYGHEARELYSAAHASGTLTHFTRHTSVESPSPGEPEWLQHPGERDITAHVDFTSLRAAAESSGLQTIGLLDQTYFLLGLLTAGGALASRTPDDLRSLKSLLIPGGLGSTHKVLILGKGVGVPPLAGCSYRVRIT